MTSDLYLIAHKVRGQPAFDIAIQVTEGELADIDGPYWIIPTSGHRAYPYWSIALDDLAAEVDDSYYGGALTHSIASVVTEMPSDCPDHYPAKSSPEPKRNLLALLGLPSTPTQSSGLISGKLERKV